MEAIPSSSSHIGSRNPFRPQLTGNGGSQAAQLTGSSSGGSGYNPFAGTAPGSIADMRADVTGRPGQYPMSTGAGDLSAMMAATHLSGGGAEASGSNGPSYTASNGFPSSSISHQGNMSIASTPGPSTFAGSSSDTTSMPGQFNRTSSSSMSVGSPSCRRTSPVVPSMSRRSSGQGGPRIPTVAGTDYPEPSSTVTPGRPLLRAGKLLVMPPTWEGCSKCQGTGYKHADPDQPHDPCWRSFGRTYTPSLITSADILERAMILQKPLPNWSPPTGPPPMSSTDSDPHRRPSLFTNSSSAAAFPPPPSHPSRRPTLPTTQSAAPTMHSSATPSNSGPAPQQGDSEEPGPDAEAPPAYDDVMKAPQGAQLPPQRRGEGGTASDESNGRFLPPRGPPPAASSSRTNTRPSNGYPGTGHSYGPPNSGMYQQHQPYPPFQHHHMPPPQPQQPLVVRPGDPRLGGQLCYKCGGRGLRESFWSGDETCWVCNGIGRLGIQGNRRW